VNDDAETLSTPTGHIPLYSDLKKLFNEVLHKQYTREEYIKQFTVRINENLEKINRMETLFHTRILDTPAVVFSVLKEQQKRLIDTQHRYGAYISPEQW
jgi:phosphoenolpyruvate carboxykinase (GTP)